MIFSHNLVGDLRHFYNRWLQPVLPTKQWGTAIASYIRYFSDWSNYSKMPGHETWRFQDTYPCLFDRTETISFDAHYFYQAVWAFNAIKDSGVSHHVDVGSQTLFVGMLTTVTHVTVVDIRQLALDLENFDSKIGDILNLPFEDNSIASLSCLHVAEHIGLGRYGDQLDPEGTKKAARELARVLAPQGNLYFSLPVGNPRICFNAHRIHAPQQILDFFYDLKLVDFSGVDDGGVLKRNVPTDDFAEASYTCGLFHFVKGMTNSKELIGAETL